MTLDVAYYYIILDGSSEEAQIIDLEVAKNREKVTKTAKHVKKKVADTTKVVCIAIGLWIAGNEAVSRYPNQGPSQSPTPVVRMMKRTVIDLRGGQNRPLGNPMRKAASKMAQNKSTQQSPMKSTMNHGTRGRKLFGITPINPRELPPGMSHGPRSVTMVNQHPHQSQNHVRGNGLKMEVAKGN